MQLRVVFVVAGTGMIALQRGVFDAVAIGCIYSRGKQLLLGRVV
ncbi:hypothetical protein [Mycolicibacterium novocastrense]|nr:hypothetical protein [Mycolicibacterium novocastrense]